ncbi:2Fe-2S iron-sulfur cluster-binding protein [Paenibacillus sp.]|jgi:aerobic-type carbon monoxide dehydrogenase small subunit (CoxS/CutS family)|uniref:(2Fe-2S)-binding protein n=1 Tax=Paenibacillus sp. TaxID=58172 RepID=UPI0028351C98|nr:2Fe-2S iron-sulfur cluster-binding protein [Paenibacillus sp.]MDR0267479.1 (2Fe-2S)-binding protein [Paenibacillus sp.]
MSNFYILQTEINGRGIESAIPADRVLVDFIRDDLKLTGTHIGCDSASCGACTVVLDSRAVKSCSVMALQCQHKSITTVEGLSGDSDTLHPLQKSFRAHFALQCGYCTPGFLMNALAMLKQKEILSREEIKEQLKGNLCRCTGYTPIVEAIYECMQEVNGDA